MNKFAFLFHPFDLDILINRGIKERAIQTKDRRLVERSLRWLPPVRRETAYIRSITGQEVLGEMILVPLICDQILNMEQKFVLDKTIAAAHIAEDLGVKIIGLGAYLSPVGRRGVLVARAVNIPVTSGTTYTISTAIDATLAAAEQIGLSIHETRVTVVGATGAVGKVYAHMLSDKVKSLVLAARNGERLRVLEKEIRQKSVVAQIRSVEDIKEAVRDSDIVVMSTNTPTELLDVKDLPAGCVVCDISVPHNISSHDADKSDVLVIDGGLVQCPSEVNFDYLALPPGVAYACLSEVMILALEGKYENYSTGGEISIDKINEINALARKHGFKLAEFRSFGVSVTKEKIERVKNALLKRRKKSRHS